MGKDPWWQLPVFNFYEGYLTVNVGGTYIRSAQRFEELPRHSEALKEALDLCSHLCDELSYDMEFLQGDVQVLHNHVTCHSRTEFEDYPEPERRRNLLRLWLATPRRASAAAHLPRPLRPLERRRTAGRRHRGAGDRVHGAVVSGVGKGKVEDRFLRRLRQCGSGAILFPHKNTAAPHATIQEGLGSACGGGISTTSLVSQPNRSSSIMQSRSYAVLIDAGFLKRKLGSREKAVNRRQGARICWPANRTPGSR